MPIEERPEEFAEREQKDNSRATPVEVLSDSEDAHERILPGGLYSTGEVRTHVE
jgi:hypothetical protein